MIGLQTIAKKSRYSRPVFENKIRRKNTALVLPPVYWTPPKPEDENKYSDTPEYPKIEDLSPRGVAIKKREDYAEKFKTIKTVEEKLMALNLPKYYGWPSFSIKEGVIPYDFLPLSQFVTRTVISENKHLPSYMDSEKTKTLLAQVKSELEKVLVFENTARRLKCDIETKFVEEEKEVYYSPLDKKTFRTKHLIKQFNSAIVRVLAPHYPHLFSAQVDYEPRLEAFWRVGGFYTTADDRKLRKDKQVDESLIDDPIDRFFQYFGAPVLQIRDKHLLPPLPKLRWTYKKPKTNDSESTEHENLTSENTLKLTEPKTTDASAEASTSVTNVEHELISSKPAEISNDTRIYPLQEYRYRPDLYLNLRRERMYGTVIPGFWPNDPYKFGTLSYHSSDHLMDRPAHYGVEERKEALYAQAILSSFAWTYGLACYQGFSTYNDVTYSFPSQSVITDGKVFSTFQYQLNTIVLHSNNTDFENSLYNECYATPPEELYHEISDGKIQGWNDELLLNLLRLYTNVPTLRESLDLSPYLDKNEKYVCFIEDKMRRSWVHDHYRKITARRVRHVLDPEIYDWERIFKVEHQRRVIDARKRFFEKFEDPINDLKFGQQKLKYVPKSLRPPNTPKTEKYEKRYYPDVYPDYHEIV